VLILLSPSKTLDESSAVPSFVQPTQPVLLAESAKLAETLKDHSVAEIAKLMSLSDKLAQLNFQRYQQWHTPFTAQNARPAIYSFKGDVYEGLDVATLPQPAIERAQQRLRILSGLYGVLRPLDLMQPYRLEMGTRLATPRGKNLYQFWGSRITEVLNAEKPEMIVNLASEEYFSAVMPQQLAAPLLTVQFKEQQGNQLKTIGLFAKRARGLMARFLLEENITSRSAMQDFAAEGYGYRQDLSTHAEMVFTRISARKR
jgi:cytoplasmic iron level regulating protein YaaA (DUF328/UPF0246 family)